MQKVVHLLSYGQNIEMFKDISQGRTSLSKYLLNTKSLLLAVCLLFTFQASSQDLTGKKISINLKDAAIKSALMEVQKQSGINFSYGQDISKYAAVKVDISGKDITVKQALDLILKNTNLRMIPMQNYIVIEEKPASKSPNVAAGGGPGTIKGRIVEFETSQPLPGASVYIVELQKGIQSNNEGYFKFNNIPAGKYTLKVSYVSFTSETVQVEAKADKEETFDIKMRGSNNLSEIVVSGTRKTRAPVSHTSEKQLVGELKAAQSVVSGISSEQISKSADRNVAEAIKRVSGVTVKDDKFIIIRGMNERYNLTYLNGNIAPSTELYSRAFSLDLLPTRIIDRILIYKSPAPDLLGDMTGGAVKIFTKDAKNVKHFDIEFQTGFRENTTFNKNLLSYKGSGTDFLGFDGGTRKLPSIVPSFGDFTKAQISQTAYAGAFSNILNYGKITATPPVQLTANYYNSYKFFGKDLSMLTSFSYKNEPLHLDVDRVQGAVLFDDGSTKVAGEYSTINKIGTESQNTETAQMSLLQNFTYHLKDSSTVYFKNFVLQQGQSSAILRNTNTNQQHLDGEWLDRPGVDSRALRDIILSYQQRTLYSGNLGGEHWFGKKGKQQLNWNAGYTYSHLSIPDQRAIHLQNNVPPGNQPGLNAAGDYDQNWVPVFRNVGFGSDMSDNNLNQGMISRTWTDNTEATYNGSADYTYKFKPWLTLKAGTYQLWKQREVYRRVYTLNEGDLSDAGQPDPYNPVIGAGTPIDYTMTFFHQQDLDKVWSTSYLRDDGTALKVFDRTSGADAYIATEQNNSGYIAASLLPFDGKLDIYGGLRVEYNRQKVAGAITGTVNTPVLADLKTTTFLPSINIGYRPTTSIVFRAAYGKTVNRPEFVELSPYNNLDYTNNQTITGNPALISAVVNNYDLRFEFYPSANAKGETISLGAFYKQIDHPIERVLFNVFNQYLPSVPVAISFQNADQAVVKGLELDIRKTFDFLPGSFFRNLSLIANGSWIDSHVTRKSQTDVSNIQYDPTFDRQLQGQAPYSINLGLYYDNAGTGTKIALIGNQVGPSIYAAAVPGQKAAAPGGDPDISISTFQGSLIQLTRRQLDLSITQRVIKSLQAKFSIQNLLNDGVQMAEDDNFTYKYEKLVFIPQPHDPIRPLNNFDHFKGDLLTSDYKPGRFFLLTLTYGF